MNTVFSTLPVLLLCLVLLPVLFFILRPLLTKELEKPHENQEAALREVLAQELDNDRVTGMISQEDYLRACQVPRSQSSVQAGNSEDRRHGPWAAGFTGLWLVVGSLYFSGAWSEIISDLGTQPTLHEIVATVEQNLESHPGNRNGWLLLARSAVAIEDYELAVRAYTKVEQLAAISSPRIMLEYVETIVLGDQRAYFGKAETMIQENLLENDQSRESAMFLAGILNFRMENYQAAVNYWQLLLPLVGSEDPDLQSFISEQIALAQQLDTGSTKTASISVNVSLAPKLQHQVMPKDTVFVYAQAESGPRVPLAVVRMKAEAFPFSVHLSKKDSMVTGRHLTDGARVRVRAHISRSGRAGVMPGDLLGSSEIIVIQTGVVVNITINELVESD